MGILITRAILLVVLCLISVLIIGVSVSKKIKTIKADNLRNFSESEIKDYTKHLIREKALLMVVILIIVMVVASYPYEGMFLRFDTPEESLNYGLANNFLVNNHIVESDKCYFVYSSKKYYTIDKYGDKVGMVNYKPDVNVIGINSDFPESQIQLICYTVYDKKSDTSCCFIEYMNLNETANEHTVLINGKKADCVFFKQSEEAESLTTALYAYLVDGKFTNDVDLIMDGKEYELISLKQYTKESFGKSLSGDEK